MSVSVCKRRIPMSSLISDERRHRLQCLVRSIEHSRSIYIANSQCFGESEETVNLMRDFVVGQTRRLTKEEVRSRCRSFGQS